ncbi:mechanosensitive ion channel family protein [Oscillospiraceae bacterium MB08-C2-2]|nr:mechanosensitive ion channel family protein [Oscillospiraceae bacterium MB08-C2-2]
MILRFLLSVPELPDMAQAVEDTLEQAEQLSAEEKVHVFASFVAEYGPKILTCLVVLILGSVAIRAITSIFSSALGRSKVDPTLHSFILGGVKVVLYIPLTITCVSLLGVPISPIIAAFGALGLALSLAVQDTLANVAGGISVLFSRPFSKGDMVEIGDKSGTVTELGLVYTKIRTFDNRYIYFPNGDVAKSTVVNLSALPTRRVAVTFIITQDNDLDFVKKVLYDVINSNDMSLKEPEPTVFVSGQTIGGLRLTCHVWADSAQWYLLERYLLEEVKKAFDQEGIRLR